MSPNNYSREKYAELRTQNIEKLAKRFGDDPNLAIILGDRKLGSDPLIMLRQEKLVELLNSLEKFNYAEDIEVLIEACEFLIMVARKEKVDDAIFNKAVDILELQTRRIRKTILSPNLPSQNQNDDCSL